MAIEVNPSDIPGVHGRTQVVKTVDIDPTTGSVRAAGRAAASSSYPVAVSNEDFTRLGSIAFGGSSATVASVPSSTTSGTLKVSNAARVGIIIANDSTSILYVLLGSGTASSTNYTFAIPAKGTVASDRALTGYTGQINGVWAAANGSALVTEIS